MPFEQLRDRTGIFRIGRMLIEQSPHAVRAMLSQVLVVDAKSQAFSSGIEYTAMCEQFDVVPLGNMPWYYSIVVTEDESAADGMRVEFHRMSSL
jgi:hypothetical protein